MTENERYAGGQYDEALQRLHRTGPEFDGWLSNHGPMVVEALARHGASDVVHRWTDRYSRRLEDLPTGRDPITDRTWRHALGRPERLGDWLAHFAVRTTPATWSSVLRTWWPRLLPGLAAGATHGVIRTGHAVLALRAEVTEPRTAELAQALGYWAARWQPVPIVAPRGTTPPAGLVTSIPRVPRQEGGIGDRLAQLDDVEDWPRQVARLTPATAPDQVPDLLAGIVDAVVGAYPRLAPGNPTMLVHAATAPNAVLRTLPSLPADLWLPSLDAAWSASAAVLAAYRPEIGSAAEADPAAAGTPVGDPWERAVADGGEHVIKLADTARDTAARGAPEAAARAVATAVRWRA
jgi:hypothetical protein